jgi:hypothetical protein
MANAPPDPPLADHGGHDGHFKLREFEDVAPDGLALATLLGTDTRVGPHGVDEAKQRQPKLLGQLGQAQCLAVALGTRHAEIAQRTLLGVATALVADDHAGLSVESSQAADDGRIVRKVAVAMQFDELGEEFGAVIKGLRPLRMARNLVDLPGRQTGVDVLGELLALLRQPIDFFGDIDCRLALHVAQFVDLAFQLGNGLLKLQEMSLAHGRILSCQYSTGSGSSERHKYQVATERNGAQASPTSRASARLTGSPLK